MEIDLDDDPGSLLDSLNVWREVIMGSFRGIPGLSHSVEFKLFDLLTSELDHELVSPPKRARAARGEC